MLYEVITKPSNVLITKHDGAPSPVVIDFGIAKATGEDLLTDKTVNTSMGPIIGTPVITSYSIHYTKLYDGRRPHPYNCPNHYD